VLMPASPIVPSDSGRCPNRHQAFRLKLTLEATTRYV